uniref:Uncharacterized protein n=1 Tax=Pseudo-nitzschia australis TaxID=44445 RepID=A0A7S4EQE4_9STRA
MQKSAATTILQTTGLDEMAFIASLLLSSKRITQQQQQFVAIAIDGGVVVRRGVAAFVQRQHLLFVFRLSVVDLFHLHHLGRISVIAAICSPCRPPRLPPLCCRRSNVDDLFAGLYCW